jgi:phosphopantetheine--protein transferase-like protein
MDLTDVEDVRDALARFGTRYLDRVFTSAEIAASKGGARTGHLASCFAAKEATLKVLPGDGPLPWTDIELSFSGAGTASLNVYGSAATAVRDAGIRALEVSVASTDRHATAVVLAVMYGDGGNDLVDDRIRKVIRAEARLGSDVDELPDDGDLYRAGMTSHASVNLMLALENEFDVEFPDVMLKRSVFESIASIRSALEELTSGAV